MSNNVKLPDNAPKHRKGIVPHLIYGYGSALRHPKAPQPQILKDEQRRGHWDRLHWHTTVRHHGAWMPAVIHTTYIIITENKSGDYLMVLQWLLGSLAELCNNDTEFSAWVMWWDKMYNEIVREWNKRLHFYDSAAVKRNVFKTALMALTIDSGCVRFT